MTTSTQALDWIRAGQQALGTRAPEWLAEHRRAALEAFERHGFPTTREEAWRFTNIGPIAGTTFALAPPEAEGAEALVAAHELRESAATAVVVNGCFDEQLSSSALPLGVVVDGLAGSFEQDDSTAREAVTALATDGLPFATLNAAFLEDGVHVVIPEGAVLTAPIHVLLATLPEDEPVMAHPRLIIEAGAQSQASVIVSFVGPDDAVYLTNAVTQVRLDDGAVLELVIDQRESAAAYHVHHLHAECAASSILHSRAVSLGGRIVRNDLSAVLAGEGAHATLDGVYVADDAQLVDNHTSIDHALPHCTSHELYKGILAGTAKAVFNGRILVRPDAQKTDAKQTNRALLLSDAAQVNSNPQLEIFADDVKCTHGAAVGQLDEDALFYLQARGLPPDQARDLLLHAFAGEVLGEISSSELRGRLEAALFARLDRDMATAAAEVQA
ncbi:MAG: Fe-S cluster assembly protein SufD [Vicinamibacterales bacterium]